MFLSIVFLSSFVFLNFQEYFFRLEIAHLLLRIILWSLQLQTDSSQRRESKSSRQTAAYFACELSSNAIPNVECLAAKHVMFASFSSRVHAYM